VTPGRNARRSGCAALALVAAVAGAQDDRPRARDLGIRPGVLDPGPLNAITDVGGVRVGHTTLVEGERVRTGVTAIVPHAGNVFREKVQGAVFVGNAFGKLAGSTQVDELGTIETPIVLTNTLAVGVGIDALVSWTLARPGNEDVRSVNALVGETNDRGLNDIRSLPVRREHVLGAIEAAREGPVAEGSVGAGTGTIAFGFKGGIGTSSRVVTIGPARYVVGALVQSNYGGVLSVDGVPVGEELGRHAFARGPADETSADGSCVVVIATDAPISARDLKRLAARGIYALARTGSSYSNGSGDFAIAFSTAPGLRVIHDSTEPRSAATLPTDAVSPLFQAALESVEEAVLNSMLRATTVTGNGRTVEAIDVPRLKEILRRYGR
jgi:D-aminopeptidase